MIKGPEYDYIYFDEMEPIKFTKEQYEFLMKKKKINIFKKHRKSIFKALDTSNQVLANEYNKPFISEKDRYRHWKKDTLIAELIDYKNQNEALIRSYKELGAVNAKLESDLRDLQLNRKEDTKLGMVKALSQAISAMSQVVGETAPFNYNQESYQTPQIPKINTYTYQRRQVNE